jgi:hypothetical protein
MFPSEEARNLEVSEVFLPIYGCLEQISAPGRVGPESAPERLLTFRRVRNLGASDH